MVFPVCIFTGSFYMIFYYKRAGWVAIALIANVFYYQPLASLGAALTLPGIAGLVLTIEVMQMF